MNAPYRGTFRVSQIFKHATHDGLDLVGISSKAIRSTVNGTVLYAGWENARNHRQGFGQYVKIRRTGTNEVYYFGHLSVLAVRTGDTVRIGDCIGTEGSTGRSTGSHCHYCMRYDGRKGNHGDINAISGIPNACGTYTADYQEALTTLQNNAAAAVLQVGDPVRVRADARDYTGHRLASFVYKTCYTVLQIHGDRVVIGLNGAVTAAMRACDLTEA